MKRMIMMRKTAVIIAAAVTLPTAAHAANWEMRIKAETASKAANGLSLGQRENATDGFDGAFEVPAYVEGNISAYFPHPEWGQEASKFWRDIQGPEKEKNWLVRVESNRAGETISLSWNGKTLPAGTSATLTDNLTGEKTDMTAADSYAYKNTGPREFTIETVQADEPVKPRGPAVVPPGKFQEFPSGGPVNLVVGSGRNPHGDLLQYRVEIYSDNALQNGIFNVEGLTAGDGELVLPLGALPPGSYFWRAEVYDGASYSGWSGTRSFRVGEAETREQQRIDKAYGKREY